MGVKARALVYVSGLPYCYTFLYFTRTHLPTTMCTLHSLLFRFGLLPFVRNHNIKERFTTFFLV